MHPVQDGCGLFRRRQRQDDSDILHSERMIDDGLTDDGLTIGVGKWPKSPPCRRFRMPGVGHWGFPLGDPNPSSRSLAAAARQELAIAPF